MDYLKITFTNLQPEQKEILIAQLDDAGYEGFEEKESSLDAFIRKKSYDPKLLNEICFKYQLSHKSEIIKKANWNKLWEANFQPVVVNDFVAVRTDFHNPIKNVEHEIIITPKMSFGTGHHATTYMMIEMMKEIDLKGKSVLDFGTGTGILAILAEKLGAESIIAIDNDDWSIQNAKENIKRNNCKKIKLERASDAKSAQKFDVILANINKNVILDNIGILGALLKEDGIIILSGLLCEDEKIIIGSVKKPGIFLKKKLTKNNWIALFFKH